MIFAGFDRLRAIRPLSLKIGLALAVAVVATTLLAMVWTPQDPLTQNTAARLMTPSASHLFGTDALGRDVLSLVMAGAANSLGVAGAGVLIGLIFGVQQISVAVLLDNAVDASGDRFVLADQRRRLAQIVLFGQP